MGGVAGYPFQPLDCPQPTVFSCAYIKFSATVRYSNLLRLGYLCGDYPKLALLYRAKSLIHCEESRRPLRPMTMDCFLSGQKKGMSPSPSRQNTSAGAWHKWPSIPQISFHLITTRIPRANRIHLLTNGNSQNAQNVY
jgi:hypothetical protein